MGGNFSSTSSPIARAEQAERRVRKLEKSLTEQEKDCRFQLQCTAVTTTAAAGLFAANFYLRHRLGSQEQAFRKALNTVKKNLQHEAKAEIAKAEKNAILKFNREVVFGVADNLEICQKNIKKHLDFLRATNSSAAGLFSGKNSSSPGAASTFSYKNHYQFPPSQTELRAYSDFHSSVALSEPARAGNRGRVEPFGRSTSTSREEMNLGRVVSPAANKRAVTFLQGQGTTASIGSASGGDGAAIQGRKNSGFTSSTAAAPNTLKITPRPGTERAIVSRRSTSAHLAEPVVVRQGQIMEDAKLKMQRHTVEMLLEGVELTHESLLRALRKQNIHRIHAVPKVTSFDPEIHEALAERSDVEANKVAAVYRHGYYCVVTGGKDMKNAGRSDEGKLQGVVADDLEEKAGEGENGSSTTSMKSMLQVVRPAQVAVGTSSGVVRSGGKL
ncbi:unnamed protein product [Amoebophrya sp. A120]|nr:unnamed protein product [Amoebophrya sp. A120]|eukprot:GSA120T00017795001.1